ncbi:MAG: hypothetical protein OEN01_07045 [Candidatus Krumholzibacteria bacterium]|nr:hypothetical protein [Candidatus Krumholzibacteria bacterium]
MSVHTKKYYRVVLEEIDRSCETIDTFSIKLSMRTRTPLPRVRQVVRKLPYAIKSGLSAAQANKLKSILEEIGGRTRLETHFVTPGRADSTDARTRTAELVPTSDRGLTPCPACGWEDETGAEFCSFCQQSREGNTAENHKNESPNPSDTPRVEEPAAGTSKGLTAVLLDNAFLVVAGLLVILLAVLILKQ